MKLGKSVHFMGSPSFSWWEVRCIIFGRWPEMHTSRHLDPQTAALDPATAAAMLTAEAVQQANWQRARGEEDERPTPARDLILRRPGAGKPAPPSAPRRVLQPEDPARIRAELDRLRQVAVPV